MSQVIDKLAEMLKAEDSYQTATDLLAWYNVREDDVDTDDLRLLARLSNQGRFEAWDCPTCGERVYMGEPEDWGDFQGVCQVDYVSYPAGSVLQCDSCRCYHPAPS